jgi:hypothetical protein
MVASIHRAGSLQGPDRGVLKIRQALAHKNEQQ